MTELSTNSTSECTTLWRWTRISIFSALTPKSHAASISSSPLFIIVAESMVIFAPMLQFGWRSACSGVTFSSSARLLPKNGPPEAVRIRRFICRLSRQPCMDWNIAECSLSTGRIDTPLLSAASVTSLPPATSDSLLARAKVLPASIALRVGSRPAMPTMLLSTVSVPQAAHSATPSLPARMRVEVSATFILSSAAAFSSATAAMRGENSLICPSRISVLTFEVSATISKPRSLATSSA